MTASQSIIRSDRAGVFYAQTCDLDPETGVASLKGARRLHYWEGAASLSQVAMEGIGGDSRLTMSVPAMVVLGVIEVIPCAPAAIENLDAWPEWKVSR